MSFRKCLPGCILSLIACGLLSGPAMGQQHPRSRLLLSGQERDAKAQSKAAAAPATAQPAAPQEGEHPLDPVLRWAREGLQQMNGIQDYSTIMVKRERVDGKLAEAQYSFLKCRQKPFSVYLYFLKPEKLRGQEVIWSPNANNGKMLAHGVGLYKAFGTVPLDPTGRMTMQNSRYPITEIGLHNLVRHLIDVGEKDRQYGECEVKYYPGVKINDRVCTCIQVVHPQPRQVFLFHIARIFVDDELKLPIRFESYEWPNQPGGPPELVEEYTFLNLKLNNGFTEMDFDVHNPNYGFPNTANKEARREEPRGARG
jgi:hypothetical protein